MYIHFYIIKIVKYNPTFIWGYIYFLRIFMPVYNEEHIFHGKMFFLPKTRYQEIYLHLKRKYSKYPWFQEIKIATYPNKDLKVLVCCKYEIDDTFFKHHELGYDIEFYWDDKKYLNDEDILKKIKDKFKKNNYFIDYDINKITKKIIITTNQYPNGNIKLFPESFKDRDIEYKFIPLDDPYEIEDL